MTLSRELHEKLRDYAQSEAAKAPPLTDEKRAQLRALLRIDAELRR